MTGKDLTKVNLWPRSSFVLDLQHIKDFKEVHKHFLHAIEGLEMLFKPDETDAFLENLKHWGYQENIRKNIYQAPFRMFFAFCIIHQRTAPYSPHQNDVAERKNNSSRESTLPSSLEETRQYRVRSSSRDLPLRTAMPIRLQM
ncbi:hypothetical protein QOT17_000067 [Balamuthia mandrillaris]